MLALRKEPGLEQSLIASMMDQKIIVPEDIQEVGEYVTMVLEDEIMKDLCELYPETDRNLKYRSLDRRAYFMKHMDEQWE